ncbi:MAG: hypothetical protein IJE07_09245 [Clostridia bacterium]|nr:hypothetical protein [Clostridia bacterium]
MSFWLTTSGRSFIRRLTDEYRLPNQRILLVLGPYSEEILRMRLKELAAPLLRICTSYPDLDALCPTIPGKGNSLILLQTLFSALPDPMARLKAYCRRNQLTLMFAPFEVAPLDYAQDLDLAIRLSPHWKEGGPGWEWVVRIADESARILSGGAYSCYIALRSLMMDSLCQKKGALPDIAQCVSDLCHNDTRELRLARRLLQENIIDNELIQERWIILWSMGLAACVDGAWQYACQLLEQPRLINQLQNRIQLARLRTLSTVCQAWVEYCTTAYELPAWSGGNAPRTWYPVSVREALVSKRVQDPDATLCTRVVQLRNWIHHGEDPEKLYQNRVAAMQTAMQVVRRLLPCGSVRS